MIGSASINTGLAPICKIGATVVGKPAATVITSSPLTNFFSFNLYDVRADIATKFALEPELTNKHFFAPRNSDNSFPY